MKNFILYILAIFILSCEDIIEIDVDNAKPQMVVEGRITTQNKPVEVKLSLTANCYDDSEQEIIDNAKVTIEDNLNNKVELLYQGKGIYKTATNYKGEINRTYTLSILYNNENYRVVEKLSAIAKIDCLDIDYNMFDNDYLAVFVSSQDPIVEGNYYKWHTYINNRLMRENRVAEDKLVNGRYISKFEIYDDNSNREEEYEKLKFNDSIIVEQMSISKEAYQFFYERQIQDASKGNIFSSPAANINGNIIKFNNKNEPIGKALGCFYAADIDRDTIVIKKKIN